MRMVQIGSMLVNVETIATAERSPHFNDRTIVSFGGGYRTEIEVAFDEFPTWLASAGEANRPAPDLRSAATKPKATKAQQSPAPGVV